MVTVTLLVVAGFTIQCVIGQDRYCSPGCVVRLWIIYRIYYGWNFDLSGLFVSPSN